MKSEKQLYQWDTNQSLVELSPPAQYVDYPIGGGTLEERVTVLEEVMQEAVMAVMTTKEEKGGD